MSLVYQFNVQLTEAEAQAALVAGTDPRVVAAAKMTAVARPFTDVVLSDAPDAVLVRVIARREIRRAGHFWPMEPVNAHVNADQLAELRSEPALIVTEAIVE